VGFSTPRECSTSFSAEERPSCARARPLRPTLPQADLAALAAEVDAVLSMIPEHDRVYEDA
jgi:hypothetical protein